LFASLTRVLVVSGLHVGLILFIFFFVLKTLGVSRKIISMLAFPIFVYYALLTRLRAPVMRASFMAFYFHQLPLIGLVANLILDHPPPP